MPKIKTKKVGSHTRLYNRPTTSKIYVIRYGIRSATPFTDTPQGWIDAERYYYEQDLMDEGIEVLRPAVKARTLQSAFAVFLDEYAAYRSKKTVEQYIYAMKFFFPDPTLTTANTEGILKAIHTAKKSGKVTDSTINSYMRSLSKIFNWFVKKKLIRENPIDPDDIPKPDRAEPKNWEDLELQKLWEHFEVSDPEFYCLIRFLYYSSMRIHQALSLTWANVLWDQEVITIKRKGRKEHYQFPITRQIEAVLNKLPKDREHVFPWGVNSRSRLYKRLQNACDELGIDRDGRAFHVFRKTRITKLAEKNIFLTSQSADVSPKTMNANYIRNKSARDMKEFLEQE